MCTYRSAIAAFFHFHQPRIETEKLSASAWTVNVTKYTDTELFIQSTSVFMVFLSNVRRFENAFFFSTFEKKNGKEYYSVWL